MQPPNASLMAPRKVRVSVATKRAAKRAAQAHRSRLSALRAAPLLARPPAARHPPRPFHPRHRRAPRAGELSPPSATLRPKVCAHVLLLREGAREGRGAGKWRGVRAHGPNKFGSWKSGVRFPEPPQHFASQEKRSRREPKVIRERSPLPPCEVFAPTATGVPPLQ
jgi:hypothetical protein